ncbi:zinc-dependent alcohol dehydrogenase [Streptomyces sp. NBC_01431]|uniref:zinc-dependent alcohol dehydrogenase n=1 Tax=Streptomyces sp. NBC_01431 TaxID=2903863 RepID=UPI002E329131|nr:zinc-binding alcohol dehydrogenase [Streptomyces sp. NBC_01431]
MQRPIRAFWVITPGHGEIVASACLPARPSALGEATGGNAVVRTLYSAVSRGTESLVFNGRVPVSQYAAMRAPFQGGDFPGPVKYGYLTVGQVEVGPDQLVGRNVFCLHPHQTRFTVPAEALVLVPDTVPPERAVLAGIVETALNALWDAPPRIGDRIAVVGAGLVGSCVAALLARFPGLRVELVDVDPARADIATALGVGFADPARAADDCDLVFHASATQTGLVRSLELLASDGSVVDLSWYGDQLIALPLGEFFHSRRLALRSSQVGAIAPQRRGRYTLTDRLGLALGLLNDPLFDVLITGESAFDELPQVMAEIASGRLQGLCHRIRYEDSD